MVKSNIRFLFFWAMIPVYSLLLASCSGVPTGSKGASLLEKIESAMESPVPDAYSPLNTILVLPRNPAPGEGFRIVATGGRNIRNAKIVVSGPSGNIESQNSKIGSELPCWRVDGYAALAEGDYKAVLMVDGKEVGRLEFQVAARSTSVSGGVVWKTTRGWDSQTETLYSAWINALFQGCDEQTSWSSLHEVTQNQERNFLFNHLSMGEDDPQSKVHVLMEPDCADKPYFLRAYFAWKLGLPFGYHLCDRGYLGKNPQTGQWVSNETSSSKSNPVQAFNAFIRRVMDGVHSGTARTALDNENADYYPVSLEWASLRPGTVFADPYGHTFVVVSWVPQTSKQPGVLLAADAQPDKTVAIKRFWKGNFLFNTSEVVGEPGFKAFRPLLVENGKTRPMKNEELTASSGFPVFSMQQRKMESELFYHTMERLINPKPLNPEEALADLIKSLHEQLLVRVKSVATAEAFIQAHPGTIVPMPSSDRGVFQTTGLWEDFSTPNRDLRLLIAMDAVVGFPERVAKYPQDYNISPSTSLEKIREELQLLLDKKVAELSITYTRSDGSDKSLTLAEILQRREAFEMAYNPNDGAEIRWGAPEGSEERLTCKRRATANQQATMQKVRIWFSKRLHPPT
jgi:hypothetical protein